MALKYDKFFKIGYCSDENSGAWETDFWESMARVQMSYPVQGDSKKDVNLMYPLYAWHESMGISGAGDKSPNSLTSLTPGLTMVTLKADECPIGIFYAAFTAAKNNLVNWKIFMFRSKKVEGGSSEQMHHFFTITGIGGRIVGLTQNFNAADPSESTVTMTLSPNRISWFDHDKSQGGKVGWDAPDGKTRPMPQSPLG